LVCQSSSRIGFILVFIGPFPHQFVRSANFRQTPSLPRGFTIQAAEDLGIRKMAAVPGEQVTLFD
jgi:hypothetical protein